MKNSHSLILGLLIGAVAMWVYCNRESIGLLAANKTKISGASKVWSGLQELF